MRLLLLFCLLYVYTNAHMDISSCGKSKQCIFVPAGCEKTDACRQVFTFNTESDGVTNMELFSTSDSPGNNYIAAGFSKDDLMGDDFVTYCMYPDNGKPEAHLSFNFGKSNSGPTEDTDVTAAKEHLELVHAHKDEDGMYCQLRQKSSKAKNQFVPDLNKEHVVFLARGKARNPRALGIHSLDPASPDFPFISERALNVGRPMKVEENDRVTIAPAGDINTTEMVAGDSESLSKTARFTLMRIHGLLMVIAWFLLIALAILSARYLRDHFQDHAPYGLKWWFHIHRTLNLIAVAVIIISLLIIFFSKDWRWTGPIASRDSEYNTNPGSVHSLFGTMAVIIAFIQPIMSLLRCAPDTGARPIFNWTHRILGITGIIFAFVAAIIASNSFISLWGDSNWALSIVLFYIVILILAVILFEILTYMKDKPNTNKAGDVELHRRHTTGYDDQGRAINRMKIVQKKPLYGILGLYIVFALFAVCVAIALIILLFV